MKSLLFDPYSGASGDMIMGCLLALGADAKEVSKAVESVGCSLEISHVEKSHIAATRAKIVSNDRFSNLEEANSILRGSSIKGRALEDALRAVDVVASAESHVHGVPKEEARFHEVGALDALADIAGSCVALRSLGVERVISMPISVGGGFISSHHGLLPVPGPAALEILRANKIPWRGGPVDQELLTPTGAALLAVLVDEFLEEYPLTKAEVVGYGAGGRELAVPNALRGVVGEIRHLHGHDGCDGPHGPHGPHGHHGDRVVQLETNVDDVTGEVLGNLIELLMDAGALDVSLMPAVMKKGRAGNVISVIARHDDLERLVEMIMRETGSLGVRVFPSIHRHVAEREPKEIEVGIGGKTYRAAVKVSRLEGRMLNIKPEFEDCKIIALETGLPLRVVMKKVEEEAWRQEVV
jgi:uncharacterized protein (TIGR00299 family) protein